MLAPLKVSDMFRKFLIPAATFLVVASLCFVLTRRVRSQGETHKSFTVFQIERQYDAKGVEGYHEYKIEAVRSDGSSAWYAWRPAPDGRLYRMGVIYDVAKGRVVDIDGLTESSGTIRMTEGELAFQKRVDHSCWSGMEHSSVAGEDVVKVHEVYDRSAQGSSESTDWKAPELDCFVLSSSFVLSMPPGNAVGRTDDETLFVVLGEPQASLFEVPAGYKELSPAQAADEFARRFGERPFSEKVQQRAELKYEARHK